MGTEAEDAPARAAKFTEYPNGESESDPGLLPKQQTGDLNALGGNSGSSSEGHEREGSDKYKPNNNSGEGDENMPPPSCLGSFSFPFWFIASLYKFGVYVNKLFQDSSAVHTYYQTNEYAYLAISAAALACPAVLYVIYLLGSRFAQAGRTACGDWFTNLLNGLLLIPWQIKSRADVLQFTVQRICAGRKPTSEEGESVETLNRQASVLEFFEEFYAGFLQLILQLYILVLTLVSTETKLPHVGELIASCLALLSTVRAVRRKDDGLLTGFLSTVGWVSFFGSRCVALSMAASIIHGWIAVACAVHVLAMSAWISSVAWKSHQGAAEAGHTPEPLSFRRKTSISALVVAMFGIPSLVFWPIMFQLKERNRPLIFILVCACENTACFVVWFIGRSINKAFSTTDYVCVAVLFGGLLIGGFFVVLYALCKPKYTDEVVMHDMKVENANSYGIFYDFCDATFQLPKTDRIHRNLQRIRNM